jgi:hypothetical protein
MTPSAPAARRLLPFGCGLLAAAALALPGCGEGGAAAPEGATARQQAGVEKQAEANKPPAQPDAAQPAAATGCPRQLDAFVRELRVLRRQLAVGLSYDQYRAAVKGLRASYDQIPVERLTLDCLAGSGTAAERALNKHVDAANAWGECLADASCTTATIEPVLQRKWRMALRFLSGVR